MSASDSQTATVPDVEQALMVDKASVSSYSACQEVSKEASREKVFEAEKTSEAERASAAGSKPSSFLNPTGPAPGVPPPKSAGAYGEVALFAFFVLTRAIHPSIIDASKTVNPVTGKKGFAYSEGSTVIVQGAIVSFGCQIISLMHGGVKEWMSIWDPKALKVFSIIGVTFAFGDFLEMASMGKLQGAAYQVLLQSKFIFTALMMMYMKGTVQTRLQWCLLVSMMLSMSVYMCISKGESGGEIPWLGMTFAFLKVLVSCFGSVLSDKYMKELKDLPTHVQLVQMGLPRLVTTIVLSSLTTNIWSAGLFHGWDGLTVGVTISFVVKSTSTLYLVALLDSILKNIGEALAVLVIYAWQVYPQLLCTTAPEGVIVTRETAGYYCDPANPFQMPPLLAVIVVVLIVGAYLDAKTVVDKAKKYDAMQKEQALDAKAK